MSSNPFRKKGPAAVPYAGPESRFPAFDSLDTSSPIPQAAQPPPPTSFGRRDETSSSSSNGGVPEPPAERKAKVVKKVRVLSPPPLSPDSPEWPFNKAGMVAQDNPFSADDSGSERQGTPPLPPPSRALFGVQKQDTGDVKKVEELREEMRGEGEALKAANEARGSLNVDSFRRLLMTGNVSDGAGLEAAAKGPGADGAYDTSSRARQSHVEEDEGGLSDSSASVQLGRRKKAPPPPPSSRHGKSIKSELEAGDRSKPRSPGEMTRSPPPQSPDAEATSSAKKAAPAPPPRRGHARGESKSQAPAAAQKVQHEEDPPSRSSMDSIPARPGSSRYQASAPAPPPPRKSHSGHKPSPTSATFNLADSERSPSSTPLREAGPESTDSHAGNSKSSAPPPPPTRNSSTRRPPSVHSISDITSRQVSGEPKPPRDGVPPPPPPARKRGSSKSSMDGPPRRTSAEVVPRVVEEPTSLAPATPGQGNAILADLDALQREVDALRGKMG